MWTVPATPAPRPSAIFQNEESRAILDFLFAHIARPKFHCRFRWRSHSVAIWDNRSTVHKAMWDYHPQVRIGHRVIVQGDNPF